MKACVLGDGAMGTACSILLAQNLENRVNVWSAFPEHAAEFQSARTNTKFLPGIPIPETIEFTSDIDAACDGAEFAVAAIPTVFLRSTLERIKAAVPASLPVVSIIKGLENDTFQRPTEIILETLGPRSVAVLSGPSHAEEIARDLPASVVVASRDQVFAELVQAQFCTPRFRVYTNQDILGVELAGALKNVIGIAAGVCDGLGFGDNAKSALLTRGIVEMKRFGVAFGASESTFAGMAGIGDLITTCISKHGRNRHVGELLGKGLTLDDILKSMNSVAEGVATSRAIHEVSTERGIDMPITREVFRVIYENKAPLEAVNDLMLRELKSEIE